MKVVALTGAGISKSAGIPTFEEIPNLKDKLSVEFKQSNPKAFNEAMNLLKDHVKDKEPTLAHKALAELQIPIITMNVDGLHKKAGSRLVYEIHGNCIEDNVVLYGQNIYFAEEAKNLIVKTAIEAKKYNEESMLLIIGTSMQTSFPYLLMALANQMGMQIYCINNNADIEVPLFLKENVFLSEN